VVPAPVVGEDSTMTAERLAEAPVRAAVTSTWREDLVCALVAWWPIGGLYLDGWAHTHRPDLETFFTPWHAVLYSGFLAMTLCLVLTVIRRREQSAAPREWVPAGYGLALVGAVVFFAGGLGDTAWHQLLGVEVSLEALLSPPHLVLLTGGTLMITAAFRATVAREGGLPASPTGALPATLGLAGAACVAAFFLSYLSPFGDVPAVSLPLDWQAFGLGQYLVTTAVIVVPVLTAYARGGRVPPGLVTAVTTAVAVPVGVFTDFHWLAGQLGAVAGAVAADLAVLWLSARTPRLAPLAAGAAIPVLVWAGHLAGVAATAGVGWSVELWAGMLVLTALAGTVLGGLSRTSRWD
jgi:hypothetical protein